MSTPGMRVPSATPSKAVAQKRVVPEGAWGKLETSFLPKSLSRANGPSLTAEFLAGRLLAASVEVQSRSTPSDMFSLCDVEGESVQLIPKMECMRSSNRSPPRSSAPVTSRSASRNKGDDRSESLDPPVSLAIADSTHGRNRSRALLGCGRCAGLYIRTPCRRTVDRLSRISERLG